MRAQRSFKLVTGLEPQGDQPHAIDQLCRRPRERRPVTRCCSGVTGSGKTFTMANVVARVNRPTLVIAPNKTLAAQLYARVQGALPRERGRATSSATTTTTSPRPTSRRRDMYIEKDAPINDEIDKLRHAATRRCSSGATCCRRDRVVHLRPRLAGKRTQACSSSRARRSGSSATAAAQARRHPVRAQRLRLPPRHVPRARRRRRDLSRRTRSSGLRIEFFGDEIERSAEIDPLSGEVLAQSSNASRSIRPSHYVTPKDDLEARARRHPRRARGARRMMLRGEGKLLEAQRLEQRTRYDLEMLEEMGFCPGIENYCRHLDGRAPGEPPYTLIDYFPKTSCCSSTRATSRCRRSAACTAATAAQGDAGRVRLPAALALDNRPLNFEEFEAQIGPGRVRLGHARRRTSWRSRRAGGRADHPADGADRSARSSPAGAGSGRRPARRDQRARRGGRARAGDDADQAMAEDLTDYYQERRRQGALPALRHRDASSASRSSATCARATSTCSSASTCCARGSTCRKSRWSPSSTPTRKASCARRAR